MTKKPTASPNGHAGKVYSLTLADTGISLRYRKVSPLLMAEAVRQTPKPAPPLAAVRYGDEVRQEPNEADPAYAEALDEWNLKRLRITQKLTIERGVVLELDAAQQAEVNELREWWKTENEGQELAGSDKLVYVLYIAVGSGDDLRELINAITRRSQPTEAAIAETEAAFPG